MQAYVLYFAALAFASGALAYQSHRANRKEPRESLALPAGNGNATATKFKTEYFGVYGLVVLADWLQVSKQSDSGMIYRADDQLKGPYMYTLYKDEKAVPESTVAALFTTGFVTAGISASFVGALADQYGRRTGCLIFCVTYAASCISTLSDEPWILFVGRALAGLSTTLLFAVFETWMIAEYHKRDLSDCLSLGSMFSLSVTLSGMVAIVAGVAGEALVGWTGTKTSPFLASALCLAAAFVGIHYTWAENYGDKTTEKSSTPRTLRSILSDRKILALGLTTTIFEGTMYLFVYFWSPALISARAAASKTASPPFGLIFSCFMCALMLGSLVFSSLRPDSPRDAARLMLTILALASYGMLVPVLSSSEAAVFWSFALFEACVGLYFPTMSKLKSDLIDDSVRAKVYGLMRLPLNVFVVSALGLTREGDTYRATVFTMSGALLLSAFLLVQRCLL